MTTQRPLRGSCSCGRNNYIIAVPENPADSAHVFFDGSSEDCRFGQNPEEPTSNDFVGQTQGTPITAWLRVPLLWFHSHTTSFFPDETHSMIRKTFTPAHEPHSKRNFCGYCGTHFTYWREVPEDEADYLNVTVGSLYSEDLRILTDLGLLPDEIFASHVENPAEQLLVGAATTRHLGRFAGMGQRIVREGGEGDSTRMGKMTDGSSGESLQKTTRGMGRTADGTTIVEWEITEVMDDGSEPEPGARRGERKLGAVVSG